MGWEGGVDRGQVRGRTAERFSWGNPRGHCLVPLLEAESLVLHDWPSAKKQVLASHPHGAGAFRGKDFSG
jgi:hypothetical protein